MKESQMRIALLLIVLAIIGCANSDRLESAANSTISSKDAPERKCDRPTTVFPKRALSSMRSSPVRTTLRFEVLATGQVRTVNVKSSSGQKILDDAAIEAAMKITCSPLLSSSQSIWLETWYEFKVE